MKTPMQEHIEWLKKEHELIQRLGGENERLLIEDCIENAEAHLEKEKEFITNFAMDYVASGNVGCAIWADGPPELDIEKNAREYYKEYIHTTSLDSTEWSNAKEK